MEVLPGLAGTGSLKLGIEGDDFGLVGNGADDAHDVPDAVYLLVQILDAFYGERVRIPDFLQVAQVAAQSLAAGAHGTGNAVDCLADFLFVVLLGKVQHVVVAVFPAVQAVVYGDRHLFAAVVAARTAVVQVCLAVLVHAGVNFLQLFPARRLYELGRRCAAVVVRALVDAGLPVRVNGFFKLSERQLVLPGTRSLPLHLPLSGAPFNKPLQFVQRHVVVHGTAAAVAPLFAAQAVNQPVVRFFAGGKRAVKAGKVFEHGGLPLNLAGLGGDAGHKAFCSAHQAARRGIQYRPFGKGIIVGTYNLDESIRYQLGVLDSLDAFTRKHSENVANLSCRICEKLRLNRDFTIYCTICAYLHDIGKAFIPPEILHKKGFLTNEEYEVMKTHTTLGYKMCMEDPKLRPYANGPLYHHESLNGTGYPNGLTRKDIPIEGQIIHVADEFDAIVTKREYKSHIGITETLRMLAEEAQPVPRSIALKSIESSTKLGRLNPRIVNALFKVVIDDTEYEISCIMDYMKYLKDQTKRLELINNYNIKMQKTNKDKKKEYYKACIDSLLQGGETLQNFMYVYEELLAAYLRKKETVNGLFNEIKEIKKLRNF